MDPGWGTPVLSMSFDRSASRRSSRSDVLTVVTSPDSSIRSRRDRLSSSVALPPAIVYSLLV